MGFYWVIVSKLHPEVSFKICSLFFSSFSSFSCVFQVTFRGSLSIRDTPEGFIVGRCIYF